MPFYIIPIKYLQDLYLQGEFLNIFQYILLMHKHFLEM